MDIFAIGSDWEGKFDYLNEYCQVVYLPRTEGISSTQLREETTTDVRVGIIGCGRVANRFPYEANVVSGIKVVAAYDTNPEAAKKIAAQSDGIEVYTVLSDFYNNPANGSFFLLSSTDSTLQYLQVLLYHFRI